MHRLQSLLTDSQAGTTVYILNDSSGDFSSQTVRANCFIRMTYTIVRRTITFHLLYVYFYTACIRAFAAILLTVLCTVFFGT